MVNPFKEVNWNPGLEERRQFARSVIIGFPCVSAALLLLGRLRVGPWDPKPLLLLAGIGAAVGIILLILPVIVRPFYVVWYSLACCIGLVVSNLVMAMIFCILVTFIGLARRASGKSAIRKTVDRQADSYWQDAKQPDDPQQYYKQF